MHSAEGVATGYVAATETAVTASETTMASKAAAMTTAEAATVSTPEAAGVTSTALAPQGHSQQKRERRNGHQATHTRPL